MPSEGETFEAGVTSISTGSPEGKRLRTRGEPIVVKVNVNQGNRERRRKEEGKKERKRMTCAKREEQRDIETRLHR